MAETLDALLAQASSRRQAGQLAEERALLARAVSAHADEPRAHNARGLRALADGDVQLAIESFSRAVALHPDEPSLHINLATAARSAGDTDGERRALKAALDRDARQLIAQLRLAELEERAQNDGVAAQHWSAVVQLIAGLDQRSPALEMAAAHGKAFLKQHGEAYAAALDAELRDVDPSSPEARRFRACVDHMLGRRPIYRNECAGVHYPFLPADEFFDRSLFPWFAALEARTDAIRREALALIAEGGDAIRPYVRLARGTPENKWSALDQSLEWGACFLWEYGEANAAVCERCPETVAALEAVPQNRVPGKAPTAFFSILRPAGHIPPHTGVTNTRAIVHLPLVVPEGCLYRVGGETRPWVEGEAFAFDDTIEHEARNPSDQPRIVLIFDVWNPHLSAAEQDMLTKLFAVAERGVVSAKA